MSLCITVTMGMKAIYSGLFWFLLWSCVHLVPSLVWLVTRCIQNPAGNMMWLIQWRDWLAYTDLMSGKALDLGVNLIQNIFPSHSLWIFLLHMTPLCFVQMDLFLWKQNKKQNSFCYLADPKATREILVISTNWQSSVVGQETWRYQGPVVETTMYLAALLRQEFCGATSLWASYNQLVSRSHKGSMINWSRTLQKTPPPTVSRAPPAYTMDLRAQSVNPLTPAEASLGPPPSQTSLQRGACCFASHLYRRCHTFMSHPGSVHCQPASILYRGWITSLPMPLPADISAPSIQNYPLILLPKVYSLLRIEEPSLESQGSKTPFLSLL